MEVKGYEAKDLFTLRLVHLDLLAVRDWDVKKVCYEKIVGLKSVGKRPQKCDNYNKRVVVVASNQSN